MPRKVKQKGQVGDYRHKKAKRKNNPPAGIAPIYEAHERKTQKYEYDPQLVWAGKAEHTSFEVDEVSLHIHERISTRAILEAVKKPEQQMALFGETELPADQRIEFYQHEVGWANRRLSSGAQHSLGVHDQKGCPKRDRCAAGGSRPAQVQAVHC